MHFLPFLSLFCSTTTAGILPSDSTEHESPDLSDIEQLSAFTTIVPDRDPVYNGLPLFEFDGPSKALTLPDFNDQDNDCTSFKLIIDPEEPDSTSIAAVGLGEPEIQSLNLRSVKTTSSNGDDASLTYPLNPDSDEKSFINAIALTGASASGRICPLQNPASSGNGVFNRQTCINLEPLTHYEADLTTPDGGIYSDAEVARNNKISDLDAKWKYRRIEEGLEILPDEDDLNRCIPAGGGRFIPLCCLGPKEWAHYDRKLKPRQYEKRFQRTSLRMGNCVLFIAGLPRCLNVLTNFCCVQYGVRMHWGWWGTDCVSMDGLVTRPLP